MLAQLEKEQSVAQAEIITLALHVDYWNYLGWRDEFSSPLFSQRQQVYAGKFNAQSYTPQMVVDGQRQFVGSNSNEAAKAITEAAKSPKALIQTAKNGDELTIKISDLPEHDVSSVFLAIAEDNLATKVERGENKGKNLEHTSVVRELKAVGNINPADKSFEAKINLPANALWKKGNLKAIIFVQENKSRKVIGINRIAFENK